MFGIKRIKVRSFEMGLHFRDGEFRGLITPGDHWLFDPLGRVDVQVVSRRAPFLIHEKLDLIAGSGALKGYAQVIDLHDAQRGLVWIDGRFASLLPSGLHAYWLEPRRVRVEVVDVGSPRFEHEEAKVVLRNVAALAWLETGAVGRGCVGVLFLDGRFAGALEPGPWAFWRGAADVRVVEVDLREATLDVAGQEIMSADKVSLRINALATYRVVDPRKAVCAVDDFKQALYREAQLALRAVVGGRELDALLADKQAVAVEAAGLLAPRAAELGVEVAALAVRDLILPGDMKELMNKVTEARKAAEADLITRREETAALRSQANTARLLADNPTLMRLRELEVLEKIAACGKLNVVLGDGRLSDKVLNAI
ncbi:slipin family protein [Planctomyces sp. SH-PL62]|uniref:slipin family protein n=1 Tax=Planctomyces sp. SH-PL62 TaxID=1636152 RepID=UPI00078B39C0|nr:slipin family protein [Planctomyces sp. SH-PL62]AMV36373.1 FtsH protease regulator HflK [Planctomyces sp. SH-PL62]